MSNIQFAANLTYVTVQYAAGNWTTNLKCLINNYRSSFNEQFSSNAFIFSCMHISQLETALYDTAKEKMLILARAVSDSREMAMRETKFVQDAITQLLKARHVLKCSYVYGYFLDDVGYKKPIFEFMQVS